MSAVTESDQPIGQSASSPSHHTFPSWERLVVGGGLIQVGIVNMNKVEINITTH